VEQLPRFIGTDRQSGAPASRACGAQGFNSSASLSAGAVDKFQDSLDADLQAAW
jgi:hypothetical protein